MVGTVEFIDLILLIILGKNYTFVNSENQGIRVWQKKERKLQLN